MKRHKTRILDVRTVAIDVKYNDKVLLKLCSVIRRTKCIALESIGCAVDSIMRAMGYERAQDDAEQVWAVCWPDNEWHLDFLYRRTGMTEGLYIGFGLDGAHIRPLMVDIDYQRITTNEASTLAWARRGEYWVADYYGLWYVSDEDPEAWKAKVKKARPRKVNATSRTSETANKNNALSVRSVYLTPVEHPEELVDLCSVLGACQRDSKRKDLRDAVRTLIRGMGYEEAKDWECRAWDCLFRGQDRLHLLFCDMDGKCAGIADDGDELRPYWVAFGSETLTPKDVSRFEWQRTEDDRWVAYGRLHTHYIADTDPKLWLAEHAAEHKEGEA